MEKLKTKFRSGLRPAKWAMVIIYAVVIFAALICLVPLINVLAISLNSKETADRVFLWPTDLSLQSYEIMLKRPQLYNSLWISVKRVVLSILISTPVTVLMAYPLSRKSSEYPMRKVYVAIVVFCMIFNGGLVPGIILVKVWLNMANTIWALVLPSAVPIYNVILVMNYFRGLPKEVEEAAQIDGATAVQVLFKVVVPMSTPVIATVVMFVFVNSWNEWFNGLIFMDDVNLYPFQTYLQSTIKAPDIKSMVDLQNYALVSDKTIKCAQIIIGMIPMIIAFPFVSKYFAAGVTLGAVKG